MKKLLWAMVFLLMISGIIPDACAQQNQEEPSPVDQVMMYYRTGRIDRAELDALRLLNRPQDFSSDELSELYQVLAFIAIAREDPQLGRDFFLDALRAKPDLHLDRTLTSPKILAVFDEARADFKRVQIREQDISETAMRSINLRLEGAKRSIFLPGWGQLYKGNRAHAYTFAGSTLLLGGGLVYTHLLANSREDDYHSATDPGDASSAYDSYRDAWNYRRGISIALAVVWAVNIVDALWYPPAGDEQAATSVELGWNEHSKAPMVGLAVHF